MFRCVSILGLQIVVVDTTWRYELKVGDRVDVQDTDGGWYDSEVIEVKNEGNIRVSHPS